MDFRCALHRIEEGPTNFFSKRPDSKSFGFCGLSRSSLGRATTMPLAPCHPSAVAYLVRWGLISKSYVKLETPFVSLFLYFHSVAGRFAGQEVQQPLNSLTLFYCLCLHNVQFQYCMIIPPQGSCSFHTFYHLVSEN